MTIAKSALKASCLLAAAAVLAAGALSVPGAALAGERADSCKPVKAAHKTKINKAKVHKAKVHKAKAKTKTKTVAVVHKTRPKPKVIKVAATPCDCRKEVRVVKVIQPVVEREVTVYRATPRKWHAPYVDEVSSGHYATYDESDYGEVRHEEHTSYSERRTYSRQVNTDYLAVDVRPKHHRWTRWTGWLD